MTEDVDASAHEERLKFSEPNGRTTQWLVTCAPKPTLSPTGLLSCRITSTTGVIAVKRSVPSALAAHDAPACAELENEVHAGSRLLDRYGPDHCPEELERLLGYNLDGPEPYVIVSPVRGRPIGEFGQLRPDAREAFHTSLLRGLVFLHHAGVVHGNLNGSTVYWDGSGVQIRDFGEATVAADPDTGRDIRAAGELILHAATGRTVAGEDELSRSGEALRDQLAGVFAESERRPSALTLLDRINATVVLPRANPSERQRFEEGKAQFDRTLREKWPHWPQQDDPPSPPPQRRRGRRFFRE